MFRNRNVNILSTFVQLKILIMKKILLTTFISVLFSITVNAQEKNKVAVGTNKDRVLFSFNNAFWQNLDAGIKQRTISQGFSTAIMVDLPTSENSPVSFGLGIGFASHNLHSNAVTSLSLPSRITEMMIIPDGIKYRLNKLSFNYMNIPLELRFRTKSDIRIAIGLRSGLLIDAHAKYYGHDITGIDSQVKIKDKDISNTDKYLFEGTARIGWRWIAVSASYGLNSVFIKDKGPDIRPASVGLSFSLY